VPETPDPLADLIDDLSEQARETRKWMAYYDGDQPLTYIAHELVRELDGRIKSVVINWPELVVDSLEERLDVEGFRLPGADQGDERLWEWWQANDLDGESGAAHVEALAAGRSFVIVGANDDGDFPLITVESSEQVYAEIDERTRNVRQAVKAWSEDGMDYATLYQPDRTSFWQRSGPSGESWREYAEADEHGKGIVPVVPIVNRRRTMRSMGRSELTSIVPLSDAACKIATDMMVSAEFHAMPRRWAVGASEEDFHDAEGRPLSKWSKIAGRVWTIEGDEYGNTPQVGQFPEAQLSNFHSTLHTLAQLAASVAGLPSDFFGQSTDNPASAEARRAGLERLIKRAERRQRTFGGQWEQVMRIATLWQTGEVAPEMARLETIWRDPATPTRGQVADAAVKLHAEGITTKRQAREDVGYSDAQIKRMEDEDAKAVDRVLAGDLSALVGPKPTPVPPAA
jgi:hypothetical protein